MAVTKDQWRWVVLVATIVGTTTTDTFINTPGIFLLAWKEYYNCSMAEVSIIVATNIFCYQLACLMSGGLYLNALGYRKVVLIGGIASSITCFISSFSTTKLHLLITYGFLLGIASGSTFPAFNVAVATYFPKNFSTMRGISCSGIAASFLFLPPLLQYMTDLYGWSDTLLVYSAFLGNVVVCGMILRPESAWSKVRLMSVKTSGHETTKATSDSTDSIKDNGRVLQSEQTLQDSGENNIVISGSNKEINLSSMNSECHISKNKIIQDSGLNLNAPNEGKCSSTFDVQDRLSQETNPEDSSVDTNDSTTDVTSSSANTVDCGIGEGIGESTMSDTTTDVTSPPANTVDSGIGEGIDESTMSDTMLKSDSYPQMMTDPNSDDNDVTRSIKLAMMSRRSSSGCLRFLKGGNYFLLTRSYSTLLFILTQFVFGICYNAVLGHLIPSVVYRGVDAQTAAFLMSFIGVGSFIARLANGFLIDRGVFSASKLYMVSMTCCGAAVILVRLVGSYWMWALSCVVIGAGSGSIVSLMVTMPTLYVGRMYMGRAVGFAAFSMGVGGLVGPIAGGWLFDVTQNYDCVFYIFGGMLSACSFVYLLEPRIRRIDSERARAFIRKTLPRYT